MRILQTKNKNARRFNSKYFRYYNTKNLQKDPSVNSCYLKDFTLKTGQTTEVMAYSNGIDIAANINYKSNTDNIQGYNQIQITIMQVSKGL